MNEHISKIAAALLLALAGATAVASQATAQTIEACYVDKTGVLYLIDPAGTLPGNLEPDCAKAGRHVRFQWVDAHGADHGDLSGLGDDDHSQYLPVDGSRGMTGALSVSGVVESTSGGIRFPDGTTQTSAAAGGASPWAGYTMVSSTGQVETLPAGEQHPVVASVSCPSATDRLVNGGYVVDFGGYPYHEFDVDVFRNTPTELAGVPTWRSAALVTNNTTSSITAWMTAWVVCVAGT